MALSSQLAGKRASQEINAFFKPRPLCGAGHCLMPPVLLEIIAQVEVEVGGPEKVSCL